MESFTSDSEILLYYVNAEQKNDYLLYKHGVKVILYKQKAKVYDYLLYINKMQK